MYGYPRAMVYVPPGMRRGILRLTRRLTRTPPPPRHIGGPDNPRNGHGWECSCGPCAIFWDTAEGERVYRRGVTDGS